MFVIQSFHSILPFLWNKLLLMELFKQFWFQIQIKPSNHEFFEKHSDVCLFDRFVERSRIKRVK